MIQVIRKKISRYVFVIINFLMILLTIRCVNPHLVEYFDSYDYWNYGIQLTKGQVDLFRGVYFPGLLGLFSLFGESASYLYYTFYALFTAFFFETIIPRMWNKKSGGWRSTIALALMLFFYRGVFTYALSDMWACMIAFISLLCLVKMSTISFSLKDFVLAFGMGFFAYIAYNIRTIYLFFAIGLILAFIVILWCSPMTRASKKIVGALWGFIAAATPQSILNAKYYSNLWPTVPTDGLFLKQLSWGIYYQRYDTYVGRDLGFFQLHFIDEVGKKILANERLEEISSYSQYFRLFIKYPLEFIGIYVRRIRNMFLPLWPTMFADDLNNGKYFLLLISYTVLFLFVAILVVCAIRDWRIFVLLLLMIVPVIAIMPGAAEGRFSIGMVLVMVLTLCFNTEWKIIKQIFVKYYISFGGLYIAGMILFVNAWSTLLASLFEDALLVLE